MSHTAKPDPHRWPMIWLSVLFVTILPAIVGLIVMLREDPPANPWAAAAAEIGVEPAALERGRAIYSGTCAVCHAPDGTGIPRLGKPLRNSAYVQGAPDHELVELIREGRPVDHPANTSGVAMPARGARGLADSQIFDVVHYLRTMQDPDAPPAALDQWIHPPMTVASTAGAPAAGAPAPTGTDSPTDREAGSSSRPQEPGDAPDVALAGAPASTASSVDRTAFVSACSACHGENGGGVDGLGKPLDSSDFVRSKTDQELIAFIKTGRPIWDPENTTGLDMPPKGGNPALSDDDLQHIVSYIRALQN